MSRKKVICEQIDRVVSELKKSSSDEYSIFGLLTYTKEFLRTNIGENNEFYWEISSLKPEDGKSNVREIFSSLLLRLKEYVELGFLRESTPLEQAKIEISSGFLSQSKELLDDLSVHPAASCMLIGATLEQFLISMLERHKVAMPDKKSGLQSFANLLKTNGIINRQDVKDITSWAGLRNEAAHGEWDQVADRARIRIMLEGVNLFVRKYGQEKFE